MLKQLNVFAEEDIDAAAEALNDVSQYENIIFLLLFFLIYILDVLAFYQC